MENRRCRVGGLWRAGVAAALAHRVDRQIEMTWIVHERLESKIEFEIPVPGTLALRI